MKLGKIAAAAKPLFELCATPLDYKSAHALMTLRCALKPHLDFYAAEQMKLMNKYGEKDEEGKLVWKSAATFSLTDAAAYAQEMRKLGDVDADVEPVTIKPPEKISADTIEALEGMVIFDGEQGVSA